MYILKGDLETGYIKEVLSLDSFENFGSLGREQGYFVDAKFISKFINNKNIIFMSMRCGVTWHFFAEPVCYLNADSLEELAELIEKQAEESIYYLGDIYMKTNKGFPWRPEKEEYIAEMYPYEQVEIPSINPFLRKLTIDNILAKGLHMSE